MTTTQPLWDALNRTYDDTVEDASYDVPEDDDHGDEEEWEKGVPPFVRKLTKMVSENKNVFVWTPEGSFIVKDPDNFSGSVLPKYFKSIKFCSFVRQLNMYGFHKVDDPTGVNSKHFEFKNSNFVPGKKDLLKKIERRKAVKRTTRNDDDPASKQANTSSASRGSAAAKEKTVTISDHPEKSSDEQGALKTILETIVKLQQQTEINQMALKQVLDELNYYRKNHFELEHKLNQYISTSAPPLSNSGSNVYYNHRSPSSVPQSPVPQSPQSPLPQSPALPALSGPSPASSPSPVPSPSHSLPHPHHRPLNHTNSYPAPRNTQPPSHHIPPHSAPSHPSSHPPSVFPLGLSMAETSNGMASGTIPQPPSVAKYQSQNPYDPQSTQYYYEAPEPYTGLSYDTGLDVIVNHVTSRTNGNVPSHPLSHNQPTNNQAQRTTANQVEGISLYAQHDTQYGAAPTSNRPPTNGSHTQGYESELKNDERLNLETLQRQIGEMDQHKMLLNLGNSYDPYENPPPM